MMMKSTPMSNKLFLVSFLFMAGVALIVHGQEEEEEVQPPEFLDSSIFPPTCNDCYCIPSSGEVCPSDDDEMPPTIFNYTQQLMKMTWTNPIRLDCNPYPYAEPSPDCGLTDWITGRPYDNDALGNTAVCGILVDTDDVRANQCYGSYKTQSFKNREEAIAAGYVVTHTGACGACSSTQDLAIYIEKPDLQGAGTSCGLRSMTNETDGLECYKEIGFSEACAAAWLYDTTNTRQLCLETCLQHVGKPPNLNSPGCPLNDCINCNEVESGPYFKIYAARTRRGSGLLSYIIRNCSELVTDVIPLNPCPNGYTPGLEEESYPPPPPIEVEITSDDPLETSSAAGGRGRSVTTVLLHSVVIILALQQHFLLVLT